MSYSLMMEGRSIEDLHDYINNYQKYWPDAIEAAVEELKKRGEIFTLEEQATIDQRIAERRAAMREQELPEPRKVKWEEPVAEAEPELYSQAAIIAFTLLGSLFVGCVLMIMNLKRLGNRKGSNIVVLFLIVSFLIEMILFWTLGFDSIIPLTLNIIGSLVLGLFFWRKYIGDRPYVSRSIINPIIIILLIIFVTSLLTALVLKVYGIDLQQLVPNP